MWRLILRRLALSVPVVFVVSALSFLLIALLPGNAAAAILGPSASAEQLEELTHSLGLDRPVWEQYGNWLGKVFSGDLGRSLVNGQEVTDLLTPALAVSVSLLLGALIGAVVVGGAAGIYSAARPGTISRVLDVVIVIGLAIPAFWLALLLVLLLSNTLHLLPSLGYVAPTTSPEQWVRFLILPWIALGATMATAVAKQMRDSMSNALSSPFVVSLRANGVPERAIVFKHALRSASIPVITVIGVIVVSALTTAVIAEQIFGLPGLGSAVIQATTNRDIPVIQGVALYLTIVVVVVNLLVDLAYGWLNPKVRAA